MQNDNDWREESLVGGILGDSMADVMVHVMISIEIEWEYIQDPTWLLLEDVVFCFLIDEFIIGSKQRSARIRFCVLLYIPCNNTSALELCLLSGGLHFRNILVVIRKF